MLRILRPSAIAGVATLLAIVAAAMILPGGDQAKAATGASTKIYNMFATDGYELLADGTNLYVYGFVGGVVGQPLTIDDNTAATPHTPLTFPAGPPDPTPGPITAAELPFQGQAQVPAPVIWATTNDVVEIRLKNLGVANPLAPNDPHSIHLHGMDVDAANDGVPETSVGAIPANSGLPGAGNVIVYMFAPTKPGTYLYHCHQEASIHIEMGMFGALVVYNPTDAAGAVTAGPGKGLGGNLWGWNYDKDYIWLLTDVDERQHISEQTGAGTFNPATHQPNFWMINGLSFPNTVHAGAAPFSWANWIAEYPNYDPLVTGSVSKPDRVLVRMINLGAEEQPIHMHGFHAKILGSDQRAWPWAQPAGLNVFDQTGMEKNTVLIGSGETYELLYDFSQQAAVSTYPPGVPGLITAFLGGTQTRYDATGPVSNTVTTAAAIPDMTGTPYIPGPVVSGTLLGPDPSSQYFPVHTHDDFRVTNNGVYPGGMMTMIKTLP